MYILKFIVNGIMIKCVMSCHVMSNVSVFWLCRWGVGRGLGQGSGAVGWCYVCVRCESRIL